MIMFAMKLASSRSIRGSLVLDKGKTIISGHSKQAPMSGKVHMRRTDEG
jgi:hypothetical protein